MNGDNVKCSFMDEEEALYFAEQSTQNCLEAGHPPQCCTNRSDEAAPSCPCKHMLDCPHGRLAQRNGSGRVVLVPPYTEDNTIYSHHSPSSAHHPEIAVQSRNEMFQSSNEEVQNCDKLRNQSYFCERHDWEELKFYCLSCERGMCRDCALLEHRSHDFVYRKERPEPKSSDQERATTLLQRVEAKQVVFAEQLEKLHVDFENSGKLFEKYKKEIGSRTTRLSMLITEHEDLLMSCLDGHFQSVSTNLKGRKTAIMSALDEVNQGLQIAREMLRPVRASTSSWSNDIPELYTVHEHDSVAMETYHLPVNQNQNGFFSGNELDDNVCNLKLDEAKKPDKISPNDKMKIVSVPESPTAKTVLTNGVFKHLMSFGSRGNGSGQFGDPVGVTTGPDGVIYVADYINDRVQVFDSTSRFLRTMSQVTTPTGRTVPFLCPTGLATDTAGNIIIAERGRHRITVMNPEGKLQYKFGKLGKAPGQFRDPHGVSVDKRGRLIVADTSNNRIQVFDRTGDFIFAFGNHGEHVLDYPNYAIFHRGMFIVSDTDNDCVKIYDKDGYFLRTLGAIEGQTGPLSAPSGLAIYRDEYIVVCDFNNDCVKIFSLDGEFVTQFGSEGTGAGHFSGPEAVTVTSDNLIIVTDKNNSRVQTFGFN